MSSKKFEVNEECKKPWQLIEIDHNDKIGWVEVCVIVDDASKSTIRALRFKDPNGVILQYVGDSPDDEESEEEADSETWKSLMIEDGKELIGLACGTEAESDAFNALRFSVWEPNVDLEVFSLKPQFCERWCPQMIKHQLFGNDQV